MQVPKSWNFYWYDKLEFKKLELWSEMFKIAYNEFL